MNVRFGVAVRKDHHHIAVHPGGRVPFVEYFPAQAVIRLGDFVEIFLDGAFGPQGEHRHRRDLHRPRPGLPRRRRDDPEPEGPAPACS